MPALVRSSVLVPLDEVRSLDGRGAGYTNDLARVAIDEHLVAAATAPAPFLARVPVITPLDDPRAVGGRAAVDADAQPVALIDDLEPTVFGRNERPHLSLADAA